MMHLFIEMPHFQSNSSAAEMPLVCNRSWRCPVHKFGKLFFVLTVISLVPNVSHAQNRDRDDDRPRYRGEEREFHDRDRDERYEMRGRDEDRREHERRDEEERRRRENNNPVDNLLRNVIPRTGGR